MRIDALNHLYHEGGQLVPGLKNFRIEIDGKEEIPETLKELMDTMGHAIAEIAGQVEQMNWDRRVVKYAEMFWFRKKPLRDGRGLDWKLPQSVRENILAGKESVSRSKHLSEEQVRRLAKLTI